VIRANRVIVPHPCRSRHPDRGGTALTRGSQSAEQMRREGIELFLAEGVFQQQ
jgi:hypothetical protein